MEPRPRHRPSVRRLAALAVAVLIGVAPAAVIGAGPAQGGLPCPLQPGSQVVHTWGGAIGTTLSSVPVARAPDHLEQFAVPAGCEPLTLTVRIQWGRRSKTSSWT